MTQTATADRTKSDGFGPGLCRGNDLSKGLERASWIGCQHVGRGADQQHWFEVLVGIERKVLQERIDRMGVEHEYQVAAVGWRLGNQRSADAAGGARLVLDDDGGAEPLLKARLHHSRDRVDRASRREWNDKPSNAAGGSLGEGRFGERRRP